jgi:ankyrin repeat protein
MYVEDVRRILTLLCFSTRPVTVDELIEAHAIDLSDPPHLDREGRSYELEDLVDICLGLVEVLVVEDDSGWPTSIGRIAHFSVQEYLQSSRIIHQKAARFAIRPGPGNAEIAQICLVYLLEPMLFAEDFDETKLKHMPLTRFSAMHWYYHFTNCGEQKSRVEGLVLRLFQDETNSFVTWVRLFDTDWPQNAGVDMQRRKVDMASPVYYASLLGLDSILYHITTVTVDGTSSEKVNKRGGQLGSPLQAASYGGHQECVQILLDRGANVDGEGGVYGSALEAASFEGQEKIIQILLNCCANVNLKSGIYGSALSAACYGGHGQVVRMLLDHGADVNIEGGIFGSALQAASYGGQENLVQILLHCGAKANSQGGRFGSALEVASSGGHEKVVQILLDHNADVNADDGPYGGALPAASSGGHEKVVQILLDHGADINAEGGFDGNALQAAFSKGHEKVVQILLDRGASSQL